MYESKYVNTNYMYITKNYITKNKKRQIVFLYPLDTFQIKVPGRKGFLG